MQTIYIYIHIHNAVTLANVALHSFHLFEMVFKINTKFCDCTTRCCLSVVHYCVVCDGLALPLAYYPYRLRYGSSQTTYHPPIESRTKTGSHMVPKHKLYVSRHLSSLSGGSACKVQTNKQPNRRPLDQHHPPNEIELESHSILERRDIGIGQIRVHSQQLDHRR